MAWTLEVAVEVIRSDPILYIFEGRVNRILRWIQSGAWLGGVGRGLVGEKDGRVKGDSKVFGLSD